MNGNRVVIIGAVALGPKAACRLKRLDPKAEVLMIDQDRYISYGGCGIPYFISGDVSDIRELMSTSFHMQRTPQFFEDAKGVRVRVRTRATAIDREKRIVRVRDLDSGAGDRIPEDKIPEDKIPEDEITENKIPYEEIPYDKLVIATGSRPNRLPIPGIDLPGVISISDLHSAQAVKDAISGGGVDRAAIIGAGAIGCEMAEALSDLWGIETVVIEAEDEVLPGILDRSLARIVRTHMEEKGVRLYLGRKVSQIRQGEGGGLQVAMGEESAEADLVITAVGVRPNSELAREAGLLVSPRGAVVVNRRLQTSDPNIYAGGDCIEIMHLITGKPVHFPQGSLANRQGRVIGTNLAGGTAQFEGTVGSFSIKIFDLAVASAGITPQAALREGFDAEPALVVQADRAHFYPTQDLVCLQLTVDRKTRRVLGAQAVGKNGDAVVGRINAIAAILPFKATIEDLSNLEIAYSPPFASALDIVNAAANTAENILDGLNRTIEPAEFEERFLREQEDDSITLDVRGPANAAPFVERFGERWVNIPQETLKDRMDELPREKELLVVCNSGVRSYEALRQLNEAGVARAVNVQGGVAVLKKSGMLKTDEDKAE